MNQDKINILFVMMHMAMGGSERLVHTLARTLSRAVFRPSIAWFHGTPILPEFRDLGIPLYHVPKEGRVDFSAMQAIARIVRENNIHVVNAHHFMSMVYSFYGSKVKNKARLVYTEHSEWEVEQIPLRWRKIGGYLLNRSDRIVGVSGPVAARLRDTFNLSAAKTVAIANGVNHQAFGAGAPAGLKKELGMAENGLIIGMIANFKKVKNHLLLLLAFREVLKTHKTAKLLLIGRGFEKEPDNTEPAIRHFIEGHGLCGKVVLTGYRDDIPALLQVMDIFCLTSFQEGLPISLLEAMGAGLPVVGTDAAGIRDVIMPGKNGFLVGVNDVEGLKKILQQLLEDASLRSRLGSEAKRLAREHYSLQQCVGNYEALFASVMRHETVPAL